MAAEQKEINTSPPRCWPNQEIFYKTMALLLYFLTSSPICLIKETSIQTPVRWYSRSLVHYLLRHPAFRNKSLFLASTPHLQIIGLLCAQQTELGLSNNADSTVVHLLSLLWNTRWISIWNIRYFFYALLFDKHTFVSRVFLLKVMLFQTVLYLS